MMRGPRLRIMIWSILALLGTGMLTFFGPENSWSENAMRALNFLLNFSLIAIADVFGEIAAHHTHGRRIFYKWFGINVRYHSIARFTKYAFYAIVVFHLNSEIVPAWIHMVVTGLGVTGLYLIMIRYWHTWMIKWYISIALIHVSVLLLILAFGFKIGLVKNAEFALAIAGITHIFLTNNKKQWTLKKSYSATSP